MFSIAQASPPPQTVWCQIVDTDTIYIGQLVTTAAEGIKPLGAASGIADTTGKKVVFGVVVGVNLRTPSYDSTYLTDKIVDATPLASTTEFALHGSGPEPIGGRVAMAKVAIITPETIIRGDIREEAVATAIGVGTVTVGNSAGTSCTVDSGVGGRASTYICKGGAGANDYGKPFRTIYFRSGANKGQYRVEDRNGSLNLYWDKPLYTAAAVGDTVVGVNGLRPNGFSHMQVDSESMWIEAAADASSNNYYVIVHRLDLREAGKEFAEFRFCPPHFDPARA